MVYGFVPEPITSREAELARQLRERDDQLAHANREIELLRQRIDLLVRKLFGAKSEQLDPAQLLLLLQGMDEDGPGKAPEPVGEEAPRRSTGQSPPRERGPRLPEHLPVIEEVIVPEQVKLAPQDWRRIGEEVSSDWTMNPRASCAGGRCGPSICRAACWMPCRSWHPCPTHSWSAASWPRVSWRRSS